MYLASTALKTISANVAQASVQILPANPNRRAFILYNNGANSTYITLGPTSNSSSCTFIVATFTHFNWPFPNISYTGPISAIRNAGSGTIVCFELLSSEV